MLGIATPELIIIVVLLLIPGWLFWRICSKTGYPGALGLMAFIPLLNIFLIFILAFSEWPIERRLREISVHKE